MSEPIPNRDGWMTGPLLNTPACPPFPRFTDFERLALETMVPTFGDVADKFREQIANAEVVDRINTIVGFYTRVKVDRDRCLPVPLRYQSAHFEVEGIEHGLSIILWDEAGDGYLETIEGCTVEEDAFRTVDLADLNFVRLVQLG